MTTPILLIPGLLCTSALYARQSEMLWTEGPVMIANHARDASIEECAARILDEAPPEFALAGLSMGGYIAFEILRQAPARVKRLALLDTSARPDTDEQKKNRIAQIELAHSGRFDEAMQAMFPKLVARSHLDDKALSSTVRAMANAVGPDAFVRQQKTIMSRPDSREDLPGIRVPTLVIVGEEDALTPPDLAQEIANGIPGARLHTVAESGHLSTLEQPEDVGRAMLEWMRD